MLRFYVQRETAHRFYDKGLKIAEVKGSFKFFTAWK